MSGHVTRRADAAAGHRPAASRSCRAADAYAGRAYELPRPTYPADIGLDTELIPIVGKAPRPVWILAYHNPDGLTIMVGATPVDMVPTLPAGGQLHAHGHDRQIQSLIPGMNKVVSWTDGDWHVSVTVEPADHCGVTGAELRGSSVMTVPHGLRS